MANEAEAARAAPVISSVSPASGTIGDEVTITGSGFAGATGVTFGAAASEFTVKSASQVTATVPAGAAAGPVTVTGPGGTASSREPFTVTPGITLSPASGPPAATVMVAGAGFGAHEVVDIYLGTADQALAIAGDTGNFAGITVQVPASAVLGPAYLTAAGRHSGLGAQAQFLVRNLVTVASPGTLPFVINQPGECQIQASDTASGQTLTYTATGLPPGLSINPATGLISGIPTAAGSFAVTVTAQDTTGASGSATLEADVYAVTVTSPGDQVTRRHGGRPADPGQHLGRRADPRLQRHRAASRAVDGLQNRPDLRHPDRRRQLPRHGHGRGTHRRHERVHEIQLGSQLTAPTAPTAPTAALRRRPRFHGLARPQSRHRHEQEGPVGRRSSCPGAVLVDVGPVELAGPGRARKTEGPLLWHHQRDWPEESYPFRPR